MATQPMTPIMPQAEQEAPLPRGAASDPGVDSSRFQRGRHAIGAGIYRRLSWQIFSAIAVIAQNRNRSSKFAALSTSRAAQHRKDERSKGYQIDKRPEQGDQPVPHPDRNTGARRALPAPQMHEPEQPEQNRSDTGCSGARTQEQILVHHFPPRLHANVAWQSGRTDRYWPIVCCRTL